MDESVFERIKSLIYSIAGSESELQTQDLRYSLISTILFQYLLLTFLGQFLSQ